MPNVQGRIVGRLGMRMREDEQLTDDLSLKESRKDKNERPQNTNLISARAGATATSASTAHCDKSQPVCWAFCHVERWAPRLNVSITEFHWWRRQMLNALYSDVCGDGDRAGPAPFFLWNLWDLWDLWDLCQLRNLCYSRVPRRGFGSASAETSEAARQDLLQERP
jgi:hypothetical protein